MQVLPGVPYPLGAHYRGSGTNFSLFSEIAERVELCLFDAEGGETRVDLPEVTGHCWHGFLPDIMPGQRYGFRVHGPWDPAGGHRCNPAKLLLDPYAKVLDGQVEWNPAVFPYELDQGPDDKSDADSAPFMPKSIVHDPGFEWEDDRPLRYHLHDTVIYELHVKGFTRLNEKMPEQLRGTYAGLSHPAAIDYLRALGVNTVELMPVHHFIHDQHLLEKDLCNYWGYNSIGFFATHSAYAAADQPAGVVG